MIGHVYHGDDARCVTYSSVRFPLAIAAWTSLIFASSDMCAAGSIGRFANERRAKLARHHGLIDAGVAEQIEMNRERRRHRR